MVGLSNRYWWNGPQPWLICLICIGQGLLRLSFVGKSLFEQWLKWMFVLNSAVDTAMWQHVIWVNFFCTCTMFSGNLAGLFLPSLLYSLSNVLSLYSTVVTNLVGPFGHPVRCHFKLLLCHNIGLILTSFFTQSTCCSVRCAIFFLAACRISAMGYH